mmetsp:Transcript_5780/g.7593  ORF Transcript_5780/g.7593 Transcript_5780/m.7593 type:complete len:391 (+) Transcript_5780:208-1380(+)
MVAECSLYVSPTIEMLPNKNPFPNMNPGQGQYVSFESLQAHPGRRGPSQMGQAVHIEAGPQRYVNVKPKDPTGSGETSAFVYTTSVLPTMVPTPMSHSHMVYRPHAAPGFSTLMTAPRPHAPHPQYYNIPSRHVSAPMPKQYVEQISYVMAPGAASASAFMPFGPMHTAEMEKNVTEESIEERLAQLPSRRRKRVRRMPAQTSPSVAKKGKSEDNNISKQQKNTTKSSQVAENTKKHKAEKKSKYRGVFWHSRGRAWVASIMVNGKSSHLGYFDDEIEAAFAYDKEAIRLKGPTAIVNFSDNTARIHLQNNRLNSKNTSRHSKKRAERTSEYRGVCWNKCNSSWKSCIKIKGKNTHIGYFDDEVDAAKAYDFKAIQVRGEKANLNFPNNN